MKKLIAKIIGTNIIGHNYKDVTIYVDRDEKLTFIPTGETKKRHLTTDLIDLSIDLLPPYSDADIEEADGFYSTCTTLQYYFGITKII